MKGYQGRNENQFGERKKKKQQQPKKAAKIGGGWTLLSINL